VILEKQFRQIVEAEIAKREWSQADLARAMDVTPQYVNMYLSGRRCPGPDVIERFFAAFGRRPRLDLEPEKISARAS